jgi:hypothetical protein
MIYAINYIDGIETILCIPESRLQKMKLSEAYDEDGDLMFGDDEILGLTTFDGETYYTEIYSPEEHCTGEVLFDATEIDDKLKNMVKVSETADAIYYRGEEVIVVEPLNSDFEKYRIYDANDKEVLPE